MFHFTYNVEQSIGDPLILITSKCKRNPNFKKLFLLFLCGASIMITNAIKFRFITGGQFCIFKATPRKKNFNVKSSLRKIYY